MVGLSTTEAQRVPDEVVYIPTYDAYRVKKTHTLPYEKTMITRREWQERYLLSMDTLSFYAPYMQDSTAVLSPWGIMLEEGRLSDFFGGSVIEIYPSINAMATLGVSYESTDNPHVGVRARSHVGLDASSNVAFSVRGSAGKRVRFTGTMGGDSSGAFTVSYHGAPYEILQQMTLGSIDVKYSSPFYTSSYDAWGVSSSLRMGRWWVDVYLSAVKDASLSTNDNYIEKIDENHSGVKSSSYLYRRAFFLREDFAGRYDECLSHLPRLPEELKINRVDVWVSGDVRGGGQAALLYDDGMTGQGVSVDGMNLLERTQYTVQERLGYVILHREIADDSFVAVAFSYTYMGQDYTVGQFYDSRTDDTSPIRLKMLSSPQVNSYDDTWELMMKNVYRASGHDGTCLLYDDVKRGLLTDRVYDTSYDNGKYISYLLGLDNCDERGEAVEGGDGKIDMVEGITHYPDLGIIVLPRLKPFKIDADTIILSKYDYSELYEMAPSLARRHQEKDRYLIKPVSGQFTSGMIGAAPVVGSEVSLLKYKLSHRTMMMGGEVSYRPHSGFKTYLSFLTAKSDDSPSRQTMTYESGLKKKQIGAGILLDREIGQMDSLASVISRGRTPVSSRLKLGLHTLYEQSSLASSMGVDGEKGVYIDNFDDEIPSVDLSTADSWHLASTPRGTPYLEVDDSSPVLFNKNRAAITWYTIDAVFYGKDSRTPSSIRSNPALISTRESRRVWRKEIFPAEDIVDGDKRDISTLDVFYRPDSRGEYNIYYQSMDSGGRLKNPSSENWAGIMRAIPSADLQGQDIQHIHMWVMYPYDESMVDKTRSYGYMTIDVGQISEDIYMIGEKFDESDTHISYLDKRETSMGYSPRQTPMVRSFSTSYEVMKAQDVGLNGIDDDKERQMYRVQDYFEEKSAVWTDPAGDNYRSYMSPVWEEGRVPIPMRYTRYRLTEGNTIGGLYGEESSSMRSTGTPDAMDYNNDGRLYTVENYAAYRVSMHPDSLLTVGKNYVTAVRKSGVELPDGSRDSVRWVEMRIPLSGASYSVGSGLDMTRATSVRLWLGGADSSVVIRLAELELAGSSWQVADGDMYSADVEIGRVSIVESSSMEPIPYVLPDGVSRERYRDGMNTYSKDEASMSMSVRDLESNEKALVYKTGAWDLRACEDIKVFVHSESMDRTVSGDGLYSALLLGADVRDNYYMIKRKLKLSSWSARDVSDVWIEENDIDFPLERLPAIKAERDSMLSVGAHDAATIPYAVEMDSYTVTVCGYPSISDVRVVGLGVGNAGDKPIDIRVWFNELRVGTSTARRGYALAIDGAFNLSSVLSMGAAFKYASAGINAGLYSMQDWKVDARLELGEILPESFRMKMPICFSYSKQIKNNRYSYADYIAKDDNVNIEQNSVMNLSVRDVARYRPQGRKMRMWDIENLSWSFEWKKDEASGYFTRMERRERAYLSLDYTYRGEDKRLDFKNRYLNLFSPSYMPTLFTVGVTKDNNVYSYIDRLLTDADVCHYHIDRKSSYSSMINISPIKMMEVSYMCRGEYRGIDVVRGGLGVDVGALDGIFGWGKPYSYVHTLSSHITLPFNEIKAIDFLSLGVGYNASFRYRVGNDKDIDGCLSGVVQNERLWNVQVEAECDKLFSRFIPDDKSRQWSIADVIGTVSFTYKNRASTLLPGYRDDVGVAAMRTLGVLGVGFLFGEQTDVLHRAFVEGRLSSSPFSTYDGYVCSDEKNYAYELSIRPAPHLTLRLKGDKTSRNTITERFAVDYNEALGDYELHRGRKRSSGSFSMSVWSFASTFDKVSQNASATIDRMRDIMPGIADRMAAKYSLEHIEGEQYPAQLPPCHSEVLSYSFLGAYLGRGANAPLDIFRSFPLPEISLSYDGLGYIPFFKRYMKSLRIYSQYSSRYSISDYMANDTDDVPSMLYPAAYIYPTIRISEAFSPLLGVEMAFNCGLELRLTYNRDRMIALMVSSGVVNQTIGRDVEAGVSVILWKKWRLSSDVSIRKNYVSLCDVVSNSSQVSSGERYFSMRFKTDYNLSRSLLLGVSLSAVNHSYMLPQIPSRFTTTAAFHIKYDIGR